MNSAPSPRSSLAALRRPAPLGRAAALAVAPVVLAAGLLAPALPARAAGAEAEPVVTGQACTQDDGVTVVVDLSDLGEDVRVGCATGDPASGREALEKAGFTTTDSVPGMICAIDNLPDPCPEEFDGRYWAYFSAESDGAWTAQTEGADTADPAPGAFEGWRYNDGSTGPGVEPAELVAAGTADVVMEEDAPAAEANQAAESEGGPSTGTVAALGAAVVAVAVAVVLLRRRGGGRA
ncbi:hypothetical protein ATJ97_2402 [Georgenia soli]|uniref:MYXO-CTERM domain-containing protein n=1 Tax=Georgenia soli TaxID=638953 RepID=A0A2A9ENQ0_9MICO|nr:hypothetical protein [Georgenia soli]PFG39882.1 hypothetical protein ATJ97_2402 [Georgenia soli]